MNQDMTRGQRGLLLFALIFAGEAIFTLPYHVTRFFRPTFLDVFELSATELGVAQSTYGIVAVVAYFLGGPLADRIKPQNLLAGSLGITALGGLYLASFPSKAGLAILWAFFGASTILLFWASLIKVTRTWGGQGQQGLAYGMLDGGRGLVAALLASAGVMAFSMAFPAGYESTTLEQKAEILRRVIYGYTSVTALAGLLIWWCLRALPDNAVTNSLPLAQTFKQMAQILRMKTVWLQAIVLLCAYTSYKAFDQYALFAVRGHGLDEVTAAQIVAVGVWTRPVAALLLGLIGDRLGISRVALCCFVLLACSHALFAFTGTVLGTASMVLMNTLVTGIAIFGLRGLYFGLLEEGQVPLALTGTAVGWVSVIGYLPDIYIGAVAGYLIDHSPGLAGVQHLFILLLGFTLVGAVAAALFQRQAHALGSNG